jgi:hypothetical protein
MLLLVVIIILSFYIGYSLGEQAGLIAGLESRKLPNIEEIQKRVGAYPDGKLGSETEKLWNLAICNQYAEDHFKDNKK